MSLARCACSKDSAPLSMVLVVGAPRFELGTPSPPDWCANRAALRSARMGNIYRSPPVGARVEAQAATKPPAVETGAGPTAPIPLRQSSTSQRSWTDLAKASVAAL